MHTQPEGHPSQRRLPSLFLTVIIGCAVGCGQPTPTPRPVAPKPSPQQQPTPSLEPTAGVAQNSIELQVIDLEGYEAALAKLHGKVILVDFWATWCAPCRKQFPHSVQLHRKFQDRGFTVLSVSIDQVDDREKSDE